MRVNVFHGISRSSDFESNYDTLAELEIPQEKRYKLLILKITWCILI